MLFEPPVFIMNNENDTNSYPFGDPTNNTPDATNTSIPKISIPPSLNLRYSNNIYWSKYVKLQFINKWEGGSIEGVEKI